MIKKLRIKLIAVAMISMFVVLGTIVSAINIINYNKTVNDADAILTVLKENDGKFPRDMRPDMEAQDFAQSDSSQSESTGQQESGATQEATPPTFPKENESFTREGRGHGPDGHMLLNSPETAYESRFFSVSLDSSGNVTGTDVGQIAAIDSESAKEMAAYVYASGRQKGFYGNYRYVRSESDSGVRIIFLDCMRSLSSFRNTLLMSIVVSLIGLGAVFVLVIIFSRRIVKPVSESYEKQKEFITNAGHELKTPLSIINADAEVLEMESGESEWLDDIKNQTSRLAALTNDLIFLAKMEEGGGELVLIEFPFSDMVKEAVKSFAAPVKAAGKTLATDIEDMISIKGDEKSLYKLVNILLDNANKYSPEGGYIHVGLRRQKGRTVLDVTNTTDYDLDRDNIDGLFDRFYRADKSRNSGKGGYGIGLSVAKAITEKHKGKIRAYAKDARCMVIEVSFAG